MALAGVFITWGIAAAGLHGPLSQQKQPPLLAKAISSELMASAGKSQTSAPAASSHILVLSIASSAAIYFVVGPAADATVSAQPRRYYDPASGPLDIVVSAGDTFSWIAA